MTELVMCLVDYYYLFLPGVLVVFFVVLAAAALSRLGNDGFTDYRQMRQAQSEGRQMVARQVRDHLNRPVYLPRLLAHRPAREMPAGQPLREWRIVQEQPTPHTVLWRDAAELSRKHRVRR